MDLLARALVEKTSTPGDHSPAISSLGTKRKPGDRIAGLLEFLHLALAVHGNVLGEEIPVRDDGPSSRGGIGHAEDLVPGASKLPHLFMAPGGSVAVKEQAIRYDGPPVFPAGRKGDAQDLVFGFGVIVKFLPAFLGDIAGEYVSSLKISGLN